MEAVQQAHADLLADLGKQVPTRIITARGADERDITIRENHLRLVTQAYLRYVKTIVEDTNSHLLAGKPVEMVPLVTALCQDLQERLYAPLQAAAGAAEANRDWVA